MKWIDLIVMMFKINKIYACVMVHAYIRCVCAHTQIHGLKCFTSLALLQGHFQCSVVLQYGRHCRCDVMFLLHWFLYSNTAPLTSANCGYYWRWKHLFEMIIIHKYMCVFIIYMTSLHWHKYKCTLYIGQTNRQSYKHVPISWHVWEPSSGTTWQSQHLLMSTYEE